MKADSTIELVLVVGDYVYLYQRTKLFCSWNKLNMKREINMDAATDVFTCWKCKSNFKCNRDM